MLTGDASFAEHLATLYACRACPNVLGEPVTGAVPNAKVMLVGQAPGPHEVEDRRPFAYTAGQQLIGESELRGVVGRLHRAERAGVAFDVVVLPHPSGRSTWLNDPKNRALLEKALARITAHPAWRATFPRRRKRRA